MTYDEFFGLAVSADRIKSVKNFESVASVKLGVYGDLKRLREAMLGGE